MLLSLGHRETHANQPTNAQLCSDDWNGRQALGKHELPDIHSGKASSCKNRGAGKWDESTDDDNPNAPSIKLVLDLENAPGVKHPPEETEAEDCPGESTNKHHPDRVRKDNPEICRHGSPPERHDVPLHQEAGGNNEDVFTKCQAHTRGHQKSEQEKWAVIDEPGFHLGLDPSLERIRVPRDVWKILVCRRILVIDLLCCRISLRCIGLVF